MSDGRQVNFIRDATVVDEIRHIDTSLSLRFGHKVLYCPIPQINMLSSMTEKK